MIYNLSFDVYLDKPTGQGHYANVYQGHMIKTIRTEAIITPGMTIESHIIVSVNYQTHKDLFEIRLKDYHTESESDVSITMNIYREYGWVEENDNLRKLMKAEKP